MLDHKCSVAKLDAQEVQNLCAFLKVSCMGMYLKTAKNKKLINFVLLQLAQIFNKIFWPMNYIFKICKPLMYFSVYVLVFLFIWEQDLSIFTFELKNSTSKGITRIRLYFSVNNNCLYLQPAYYTGMKKCSVDGDCDIGFNCCLNIAGEGFCHKPSQRDLQRSKWIWTCTKES